MASHDVTRSPEGDELGPIISRCEPPGDCPGCDIKSVCEEYNAVSEQELEDDEEDDEEEYEDDEQGDTGEDYGEDGSDDEDE